VPLAVALLQTMTRSAWLGVGAGVLVMLLLARPRLAGLFLAAVVAVILLAPRLPEDVVAPHMKKRLDPTYIFRGNSSQQRAYMWQRGWAMVHEHPVTGVGDRDLRAIGPDYFHRPDMDEHGHLHSNPVMLAAIWGVPGFVLGMGFLLLQLKLLIGRWRSLGRPRQGVPAGWILAGLGVWSGFFVAGLTEWYFGDAESMLLYLAITGVALGFPLARPEHGEHHV
jgi:O-antigen ligase